MLLLQQSGFSFSIYLQNLGIIFAQWLPVAALFYFAVRKAIQDAFKVVNRPAIKSGDVYDVRRPQV